MGLISSKIEPGVSGYMNLTSTERATIQNVERFGASLSLVGVSLIFVAYALWKRLRTVPNTFILFASIANVGASVAALIGYDGIMAGNSSALCQIQAFLLEMFMQSDPWWSLAMAVNVFMVFFFAASPNSFRRYLWLYSLICFGLPALPAVICLFYTPTQEHIYADATLWCWIGDRYNSLRIYTYYIPIWTCSLLSAVIYLAVGYHVFHQRNQLRNLTLSNQAAAREPSGPESQGCAEKGDSGISASYGTVTTEVRVTAEASDSQSMTPPSSPAPSITAVLPRAQPDLQGSSWLASLDDDTDQTASTKPHTNPFTTISSVSSRSRNNNNKPDKGRFESLTRPWTRFLSRLRNLDPVKLAYLRTSFVFAVSILITWTPSSINRVYSFAHPTKTSYPLNLASAVVLPLQGVWNAVIFCATSWATLREEIWTVKTRIWPSRSSQRLPSEETGRREGAVFGNKDLDHYAHAAPNSVPMGNMRVLRGGSL
ncbi:putative G-protein coupled receptor [Echria macrotheca]|uniref:G-protein coupled receptor n=1 Tax=Echria macrotheca TaxID=438768 RepID=A0AAJ0BH49_9PEZI|nr:putative G-protein coupled receptor [Echria macrotheca]